MKALLLSLLMAGAVNAETLPQASHIQPTGDGTIFVYENTEQCQYLVRFVNHMWSSIPSDFEYEGIKVTLQHGNGRQPEFLTVIVDDGREKSIWVDDDTFGDICIELMLLG